MLDEASQEPFDARRRMSSQMSDGSLVNQVAADARQLELPPAPSEVAPPARRHTCERQRLRARMYATNLCKITQGSHMGQPRPGEDHSLPVPPRATHHNTQCRHAVHVHGIGRNRTSMVSNGRSACAAVLAPAGPLAAEAYPLVLEQAVQEGRPIRPLLAEVRDAQLVELALNLLDA